MGDNLVKLVRSNDAVKGKSGTADLKFRPL